MPISLPMLRGPWEHVQGYAARGAPLTRSSFAAPYTCTCQVMPQDCRSCDPAGRNPGQPVTTVRAACPAFRKRPIAIVQHRLGDSAKHEFVTTLMRVAIGNMNGATRIRTKSATRPSAVAKVKIRSVV